MYTIKTALFPRTERETFLDFLKNLQLSMPRSVVFTGLVIPEHINEITEVIGAKLQGKDEFSCFVDCFRCLVRTLPKNKVVYDIPKVSIVVSDRRVSGLINLMKRMRADTTKVTFPEHNSKLPEDIYKWTTVKIDEDKPYIKADPMLYPCFLVMLGSACAIMKLEPDGTSQLLGFHNRCGVALQAMASLYLGVKDFKEMMELVEAGSVSNVGNMPYALNLTIEDELRETGGDYMFMPDHSVGNKAMANDRGAYSRQHAMRSILSHIVDHLAHIVAFKAEAYNIKRVFFAGSLITNPLVRHEFIINLGDQKRSMPLLEVEYNFLLHGGYYGALGALFEDLEKAN